MKTAREKYHAADAAVANLMTEPIPLVFGRKEYQKCQRAADTTMAAAKKRLETTMTAHEGAARRVAYLG